MNDPEIRKAFHSSMLRNEHALADTLVVDELGLQHGKYRADIAVINGHFIGYEIKSDVDSLRRLEAQITAYNGIFDNSSLILTDYHSEGAIKNLPDWWGIILASFDKQEGIVFENLRLPMRNQQVNYFSVAQLLWRKEAQEILFNLGIRDSRLREKRSLLYGYIVEMLNPIELRVTVSGYLKKREGWRRLAIPFPSDG